MKKSEIIFPKVLQPGNCIGLTCPAGGLKNLSIINRTKKYLKEIGYKTTSSSMLKKKNGYLYHPKLSYLAAADVKRANDFQRLLMSDNVAAVWCVRGGFGSQLILDHLDFSKIRKSIYKNPKPIVGFSDITALLLALYSKFGLVSIHGPMPIPWFKNAKKLTVQEKISSRKLWELLQKKGKEFSYTYSTEIIQKGGSKTKGILLGGNLTCINSLPKKWLPSFKDSILFLEDINEATYSIHRELINLGEKGILNQAKGIIFCDFSLKKKDEHNEVKAVIKKILKDFKIKKSTPVVYGFPIGHGKLNFAVPIGRTVVMELDVKKNRISLCSSL